ncbi:HAD family hydrolase [Mesoterricola silvestris]|uniref:Haloacid dehalogenase n=1 Tax=Mesoterricola silvestris TaxID=2927979 RepID=A0AA48K7K4_9BACT|nr:HAD family hydrolase [Mesoterricola silvestris]BDU71226.1 haloacid dehalogenase [Mesoterricola silvestris]
MNGTLLAVGFDLDYTLWDHGGFAESFFGSIAWELGGRLGCSGRRVEQVLRDTLARLTVGHPRIFDEALLRMGVEDPVLVAELVERYHRHRPPMRPYPGALDALRDLRGRGYRTFLVTDGLSDTQRYKVEALGLMPWFDERVFTGDFPRILQKPSPFPFLLACRRLGVAPRQCAYVGDNPLCDFEGPMRLGMRTIGVPTGPFAGRPVPPGHSPERRVTGLGELGGVL